MKEFFKGVRTEMKKLTLPTEKELGVDTTKVLIFMLVLSLFFWGVDSLIIEGVHVAQGIETVEIFPEELESDDLIISPEDLDQGDIIDGDDIEAVEEASEQEAEE